MFSQVEGAAARSEGGLGIGLALVHGLTELHGGTVEAKSEGLGRGSEFIVKLPIVDRRCGRDAHGRYGRVRADRPADTGGGRQPRCRGQPGDDSRNGADTTCVSFTMGVRRCPSLKPSAPIPRFFDIGMPQLNGYEVARALRQEPWGAGITLIALTGWGQESDRQQAIEAGFDRHLTKPDRSRCAGDPHALSPKSYPSLGRARLVCAHRIIRCLTNQYFKFSR